MAYRTWRIDFILTGDNLLSVIGVRSGYSPEDLANDDDIYNDKNLHRLFLNFLN